MIKDFREQAETAERLAKCVNDARTCEALLKYARECREKLEAQSSPDCTPTQLGVELIDTARTAGRANRNPQARPW